MEREMNEDKELNLFVTDCNGEKHAISPIGLYVDDDIAEDKSLFVQERVSETEFIRFKIPKNSIKDTFAYRLLFGKESQNNWRKLHGLPMRRKKCLRR